MENLMPSCLFVSSLPFSVSNCTKADALSCVQPTIPQQKDSSDWIGMVTMAAGGHKLLSCGSWHNSMHYLHPGANQSLYLISSLTNSHLLLSLTIKDAILLNSLRQGVRITENWKLILARPFSPDCRHLQALAHPHSRSSKGGWEPIASVLFSWLTWSLSGPTRLPEAGPADLSALPVGLAWPFLLRCPAVPCFRASYLKYSALSLFLELGQLSWPAVVYTLVWILQSSIPVPLTEQILPKTFKC